MDVCVWNHEQHSLYVQSLYTDTLVNCTIGGDWLCVAFAEEVVVG